MADKKKKLMSKAKVRKTATMIIIIDYILRGGVKALYEEKDKLLMDLVEGCDLKDSRQCIFEEFKSISLEPREISVLGALWDILQKPIHFSGEAFTIRDNFEFRNTNFRPAKVSRYEEVIRKGERK